MEIGELFAKNRSASDNKGSRISPRLVPRPVMSLLGQNRKSSSSRITSALPPGTDIGTRARHVRLGPINDIAR
jgi:hypothetical protein